MGSAIRNVRSFVIIDLETTGLPICDRKVKITEMVMIGALREHILELSTNVDGPHLPRVLPKLNLYAYPKKAISPISTDLTGLSNELLENVNPFDERLVNMVDGFIQRLPPPVCLIAHNGNKFDFPILQAELHNIGKALPEHLLCADSLPALREILRSKASEKSNGDNGTYVSMEGIQPLEKSDVVDYGESLKYKHLESEFDGDDYDEALYKMAESIEKLDQKLIVHDNNKRPFNNYNNSDYTNTSPNKQSPLKNQVRSVSPKYAGTEQQDMHMLQKQLETTPKQTIKTKSSMSVHPTTNVSPHVTPTSNNRKDQQFVHNPRARKKLFSSEKKSNSSIPKSFKLCDVYQFLRRKEATDAHHAESDCLNLLECIVVLAPQFLEWVDRNAVEFKELKKMW